MNNKCIIKSTLVKKAIADYAQYTDIWAPIKSIKNSKLLQMMDCSNYLADSDEQIDFLIENNVNMANCYFGSFKSLFDLDYAISKGIRKFVIASMYELHALTNRTPLIDKIFLTINALNVLNIGHDRFGLSIEEAAAILKDHSFLKKIEGLAFHLQSPYKTVDNYLTILDKLLPLINKYRLKINIGGIPCHILTKVIELMPKIKQYNIIVEPGNSLFSEATTIETQVVYVDIDNKIINLNIGIYNGLLDCKLLNMPIKIWQDSHKDDAMERFRIYGPTSDNLDFLGEHFLRISTVVGDKVYISNCGIYSLFFSTDFYSKQMIVDVQPD